MNFSIRVNNRLPSILWVILLSPLIYMPIGLSGYYSYRDLFILMLTIVILFFVWQLILKRDKVSVFLLLFYTLASSLIVINFLITKHFNLSYLYILYVLNIFYIIYTFRITKETLLKATNIIYVLYLILSLLLYFSVFSWEARELNIFNHYIFGRELATLIGFYGSTAHLDSYSFFIALLNLLFNKGKSRWFYILIPLVASIGTFRFTPIVSFGFALTFYIIVRLWGKWTIPFINIFLFSFFFIISWCYMHTEYYVLLREVTSGRSVIWALMLDIYYSTNDFIQKIFGYGETSSFAVNAFSSYFEKFVDNPHNNFLKFLLEYGWILYITIFYFITKSMLKIKETKSLLLIFFLLMASNTNAEIFDFKHPTFLLWLLFLMKSPLNAQLNKKNANFDS